MLSQSNLNSQSELSLYLLMQVSLSDRYECARACTAHSYLPSRTFRAKQSAKAFSNSGCDKSDHTFVWPPAILLNKQSLFGFDHSDQLLLSVSCKRCIVWRNFYVSACCYELIICCCCISEVCINE